MAPAARPPPTVAVAPDGATATDGPAARVAVDDPLADPLSPVTVCAPDAPAAAADGTAAPEPAAGAGPAERTSEVRVPGSTATKTSCKTTIARNGTYRTASERSFPRLAAAMAAPPR